MSRTAELDAEISDLMIEVWGTSDPTPPEQLDAREVWWRDRYDQLNNYGYLLRPRYSPQWVPSWKSSSRGWKDCEDGKRLKVCNIFFLPLNLTTCHSSLAKLLMPLEFRMGKWSL